MAVKIMEELPCDQGHTFKRERTRGRKPTLCPAHKAGSPVAVERVRETPAAQPVGRQQPLHCEAGDHEWLRPSQRGRKPLSCPTHTPVTTSLVRPPASRTAGARSKPAVPVGQGLATVTDLQEYILRRDAADAIREARERRGKERIDNLEIMLKSRGLHLSQQKKETEEATVASARKKRKARSA